MEQLEKAKKIILAEISRSVLASDIERLVSVLQNIQHCQEIELRIIKGKALAAE